MKSDRKFIFKKNIALVIFFSIAFAFVESSVVVYLRALYYPEGFFFPLKAMPADHLLTELLREFSTLVMLGAVGMLAGNSRWEKFSWFLIAFGVWDVFYYVWLKVLLDWPATLSDWDILFLIPVPWIAPVIAPVLISMLLIAAGILIIVKNNNLFHLPLGAWIAAITGSGCMLYTFMYDTDATIRLQMPQPYLYGVFIAGFFLYLVALYVLFYQNRRIRTL